MKKKNPIKIWKITKAIYWIHVYNLIEKILSLWCTLPWSVGITINLYRVKQSGSFIPIYWLYIYIYIYVCVCVCVCVCLYICIYMCIYICIYMYIYMCIYIHIYIYIYMHIYVYIYIYICIYIYVYMYTYIYIYIYKYVYVYTYIYTYIYIYIYIYIYKFKQTHLFWQLCLNVTYIYEYILYKWLMTGLLRFLPMVPNFALFKFIQLSLYSKLYSSLQNQ